MTNEENWTVSGSCITQRKKQMNWSVQQMLHHTEKETYELIWPDSVQQEQLHAEKETNELICSASAFTFEFHLLNSEEKHLVNPEEDPEVKESPKCSQTHCSFSPADPRKVSKVCLSIFSKEGTKSRNNQGVHLTNSFGSCEFVFWEQSNSPTFHFFQWGTKVFRRTASLFTPQRVGSNCQSNCSTH